MTALPKFMGGVLTLSGWRPKDDANSPRGPTLILRKTLSLGPLRVLIPLTFALRASDRLRRIYGPIEHGAHSAEPFDRAVTILHDTDKIQPRSQPSIGALAARLLGWETGERPLSARGCLRVAIIAPVIWHARGAQPRPIGTSRDNRARHNQLQP